MADPRGAAARRTLAASIEKDFMLRTEYCGDRNANALRPFHAATPRQISFWLRARSRPAGRSFTQPPASAWPLTAQTDATAAGPLARAVFRVSDRGTAARRRLDALYAADVHGRPGRQVCSRATLPGECPA